MKLIKSVIFSFIIAALIFTYRDLAHFQPDIYFFIITSLVFFIASFFLKI